MEEHLILIINSTTKSWKNIDETTAWPWNEFKTLWCHADLKWEYIFQSDWWSHFCGINSPPQLPSCQTVAWMLASRDPQTPPESYWTPLLSSNCPQSIPVKQNKSQGSVCKSECSGARINSDLVCEIVFIVWSGSGHACYYVLDVFVIWCLCAKRVGAVYFWCHLSYNQFKSIMLLYCKLCTRMFLMIWNIT